MIVFSLTIILIIVFLYYQNNSIVVSNYTYKAKDVPYGFNGYRILQISDLHNKEFGTNNARLINTIKSQKPDIIVITGDIIDRRRYRPDMSISFLKEITKISPVFYVTGNHEWWSGGYSSLKESIESCGVKILDDCSEKITADNQTFYLIGVDDPAKYYEEHSAVTVGNSIFEAEIQRLSKNMQDNDFTILLSHRPELIDVYSKYKLDLVFCGHAHGGQIRLPFVGGLIAPNQGVLPAYDKGLYRKEATTMIVSGGLGNSIFPQRIFNRPEVVVVELSQ